MPCVQHHVSSPLRENFSRASSTIRAGLLHDSLRQQISTASRLLLYSLARQFLSHWLTKHRDLNDMLDISLFPFHLGPLSMPPSILHKTYFRILVLTWDVSTGTQVTEQSR